MLLINDYRVRALRLTNRIKTTFREVLRDVDIRQDFEDYIRDHLIHRTLIRLLIRFVDRVSFVEAKDDLLDERNVDFESLLWRVDACKKISIRILNRNFEYSLRNIVYLRIDHRVVFFENSFDFFRFDSFCFCVRYSNAFYCFFDSLYRSFVRDSQMIRRKDVFADDWNHDLRLRNREIDVICESIELMMFWICWIIWSLKFRNVVWFSSFICDIKFNCQSKFTFSADRITNWRFFSEIDELNCQSEFTFLTDSADRVTSWVSVIWDFSEWLINEIEIMIMRIVRIVKVVIMIMKLINSMFLCSEFLSFWFLNNSFLSLLLSKKKSVFDDEKKRSFVDVENRSE